MSIENVKRAALACCAPEHRANVRFVGPARRRFSTRLTIENMESANMYDFCTKIYPAQTFIRHTNTNGEMSTASRLDVYVPTGLAMHLFLIYRTLFAGAGASFALAAFILNSRN